MWKIIGYHISCLHINLIFDLSIYNAGNNQQKYSEKKDKRKLKRLKTVNFKFTVKIKTNKKINK